MIASVLIWAQINHMLFVMFGVTAFYVFLRAFQQKNVQAAKYAWMIPVSICMGYFDVFIISSIANANVNLFLLGGFVGTGGAIGSMTATWVHLKLHNTTKIVSTVQINTDSKED